MIRFNEISKTYGNKILFDDLSIAIEVNDKVILRAPSGSGKTTLVKLLLGFEKPDKGDIIVGGLPLNKYNLKQVRHNIAYVSQDADLALSTVSEVFDMVFNYKANKHIHDYRKQFQALSQQFGLEKSIFTKETKQLSGGERQRVAFILALILDREIMVLDEITSGLDSFLKQTIKDYVLNLNKTILIISHDEIWHNESTLKEVKLNDNH